MKQLKSSIYFLLMMVVTLSCEKDTTLLLEAELNDEIIIAAKGGPVKMVFQVNHTSNKGIEEVISVTEKQLKSHIKHGDEVLFENVNIKYAVDLWLSDEPKAESLFGPISSWDVSNVTNMGAMFYNATSFNQDISGWDVSNVTNMYLMFREATSFNANISSWDVSKVTSMGEMFYGATSFNQDLSNWERTTPDVSTLSNVTSMYAMFFEATSFNQDLSGWCVSNIASKPTLFDSDATAWTDENLKPVWGTCP